MKSTLIMVLSCPLPPYDVMIHQSMATWDRDPVDGVRTVFYHGRPMGENNPRVLFLPIEESYATISRKNLLAFAWALTQPWDFMARVNASCYVAKERLQRAVQELPLSGLIRGVLAPPTPCCGVSRPWLWGGAQIIFSRDVIQAIVDNPDKLRHDLIEDVALSEAVQDLGFQIDGNGQACAIDKTERGWRCISYGHEVPSFEMEEIGDIPHHYFIRCKQDLNRSEDFVVMQKLKANLERVEELAVLGA